VFCDERFAVFGELPVSRWLAYCILANIFWALFLLIPKWGSTTLQGNSALLQVLSTIGLIPVALLFLGSPRLRQATHLKKGIALAFLSGGLGAFGNLAFFEAYAQGGEASVVGPLSGLYPLVTVILARYWVRDRLNWGQTAGVLLAVAAIGLFGLPGDSPAAGLGMGHLAPKWMPWVAVCLLLYGIAGVTQKLATNHISTELSTVCFALGSVPVVVIIVACVSLPWDISRADWGVSVGCGAVIGLATLVQFAAYRLGNASVTTAATTLYPAVAAAFAIPLFGERLNTVKVIAIVLAVLAGVALSYESPARAALDPADPAELPLPQEELALHED